MISRFDIFAPIPRETGASVQRADRSPPKIRAEVVKAHDFRGCVLRPL